MNGSSTRKQNEKRRALGVGDQLYQAILDKNASKVKEWFRKDLRRKTPAFHGGLVRREKTGTWFPPLHMALVHYDRSSQSGVRLLLTVLKHPEIDVSLQYKGISPLDVVNSSWGNEQDRILLQARLNPGLKDETGKTLLMRCVGQKVYPRTLRHLLRVPAIRASINDQDEDGRTALLIAGRCQSITVIQMLLKFGADPQLHDDSHENLLHCVVVNQRTPRTILRGLLQEYSLQYLINQGNNWGDTPLGHCCKHGFVWKMTMFIQNGGDILKMNRKGYRPIHLLIKHLRPEEIPALLSAALGEYSPAEREQIVNATDKDGNTLLHWVALSGFVDVATTLLEAGARVTARNHFGRTPLHHVGLCLKSSIHDAERACFTKSLAQFLLSTLHPLYDPCALGDVFADDWMRQLSICSKTCRSNLDMAKLLLSHSETDPMAMDHKGNLPFFFASTLTALLSNQGMPDSESEAVSCSVLSTAYTILLETVQQRGDLRVAGLVK